MTPPEGTCGQGRSYLKGLKPRTESGTGTDIQKKDLRNRQERKQEEVGGLTGPGYKLEVDSLTKYYPPMRRGALGFRDLADTLRGRREEVLALKDVTFKVRDGEWFGLLGPNGSGKTTLCNILLDITTPTSGQIRFEGRDVNREHRHTRGKICTMQYQFFHQRVNVRDCLRQAGAEWMLKKDQIEERLEWLVDLFEMREKLDDWMVRLSYGMIRKIWLIGTLMSGAELLVFDEPTPGMDVFTRKKLYAQLKEFQEKTGTTVFWTTHNLHEAQESCERIAVLNNELVTVTTPKQLMDDMEKSNLEDAFMALLAQEEKKPGPQSSGASPMG